MIPTNPMFKAFLHEVRGVSEQPQGPHEGQGILNVNERVALEVLRTGAPD